MKQVTLISVLVLLTFAHWWARQYANSAHRDALSIGSNVDALTFVDGSGVSNTIERFRDGRCLAVIVYASWCAASRTAALGWGEPQSSREPGDDDLRVIWMEMERGATQPLVPVNPDSKFIENVFALPEWGQRGVLPLEVFPSVIIVDTSGVLLSVEPGAPNPDDVRWPSVCIGEAPTGGA